ncbi:MAG: hypothetical protein ACI9NN_001796 [Bacteroidia bacterium]|jgi:hypothetical protein
MNKPMKTQLKTRWGSALNATVAFLFVGAIIFTLPACGGDDPKPTPDGGTTIEEYLIIDGKRYEGKDFVKKYFGQTNNSKILRIELGNSYPLVSIEQDLVADTIPLRIYDLALGSAYKPDFDLYEAQITAQDGPPPVHCQFTSVDKPSVPNGKYELKKMNGKVVSEFAKSSLKCVNGGNGTDERTIEGRVIWEEK